MAKEILGTFQSRDAADSVKDMFIQEGFDPKDLVVMVNKQEPQPPEDAQLEVGHQGGPGLEGVEEKIGKAVLSWMGKKNDIEGDGFEGEGKGGALLGIRLQNDGDEERVRELLTRHFASDIEVAQPD
jgi:hypothetical protein